MCYKYMNIVLLFVVMPVFAAKSLLRDRTVNRNCKKELELLLSEIGASSAEDALKKINGLSNLFDDMKVSSISQLSELIKKCDTQEVTELLKQTNSLTVSHLASKIDGLPQFFKSAGINSIAQAQEKLIPQAQEVSALKQTIKTLERQYADVVQQCKKVEKEFGKIGIPDKLVKKK